MLDGDQNQRMRGKLDKKTNGKERMDFKVQADTP